MSSQTTFALVGSALIITLGAGCGKPTESATTPEKPTKSSMTLFAEGVTGKTAVDAGRRAQDQIKAVSKQHNADLDALSDEP